MGGTGDGYMRKLIALTLASAGMALPALAQTSFQKPVDPLPFPWIVVGGDRVMTGLTGIGQTDFPSMPDLNDRATNVSIPSGYLLVGYEHNDYQGVARLFWGNMDIDGKLDGNLSSFKVRKFSDLQCAVGYEHAGMGGAAWPFCLVDGVSAVADPDAGWWRNVSSVVVPQGLRLGFCTSDSSGICRSYTRDNITYVGHASNDTFTEAVVSPFDDTNFQMVFMSDPQFGWGDTKVRYSDVYRTWDDSSRGMAAAMSLSRFPFLNERAAGVIVNGDVSNTGDKGQFDDFDKTFGRFFDNIYVGLGNHDYDNYLSWSDNEHMFSWFDKRVSGMQGLKGYDLDGEIDRDGERSAYNGSMAYSWDIGDVHFIQLNNYPSYRVKGKAEVEFDIRDSLGWLENDLAANAVGKRVIINMHSMLASSFGPWECEFPCNAFPSNDKNSESQRSSNTTDDYDRFIRAIEAARLKAKDNIVMVFAGHIHEWAGSGVNYSGVGTTPPQYVPSSCYGSGAPKFTQIPLFYTGGSQFSLHLVVDFDPASITVRTIDSKLSLPNEVQTVVVPNAGKGVITITKGPNTARRSCNG